jgi:acyl transferase domain-containing protein
MSSRNMAPSSNAELEGSIAIIGLASRLPGASSESEFWELLSSARSARSKVPADRFNVDAFYHPDPERADSSNVRHGHFLTEDIARFDAPFFSIQPNEAVSMDPQQRLVLETSYHALENAGLSIDTVAGSRTAVYIGTSSRDYESILTQDSDEPSKYIGTGIGTSLIANRVSWFLDLKGPSLAIDTGCSGSLVALHHACQAIRSGESDTALVGGVSLIISPDVSLVHLSNMGFFSPDGYCFSFDERANGYSKGEGVAVVVLKRLSDALRDGNTIRAIVRASSCNQDGHTPGLTVPSIDAQVENIRDAYQKAGLGFADTAFFEAHGTGTQVGDTVEAEAIHRVFQRTCQDPLYVGALKSNIGHLEAASGVAGLTKSILCLEHGIIPPNLNFRNPNPKIDPEGWGLKVSHNLQMVAIRCGCLLSGHSSQLRLHPGPRKA